MKLSRHRKKLFVDARVQGVLIRQLLKHWIIASSVIFLFLLAMQIFTTPERLSVSGHLTKLWSEYGVLVVALVTVFPVFVYDSIKLSNRIAGPMVSFRNSMGKLSRGEAVRSLSFRQDDFWHGISDDLNQIARRMKLLDETQPLQSVGK